MRLSYSIQLPASPVQVFPWITDPNKASQWQNGIKKWEILEETPNKIGTTFREILEEDGKTLEMFGTISDYQENQRFAVHLESKIHTVDASFLIQGYAATSTLQVTWHIRWKFPMNIMCLFIGRRIRAKIMKQTEEEFGVLNELLTH